MTDTKQLIPVLESRLRDIDPNVRVDWTRGKEDNFSDWSRTIITLPNMDACETLIQVFNIPNPSSFKLKFKEATQGSGNEAFRILTLHSSALLALLTFSNISEDNPLWINNIEYSECWFEVENKVFDKPSSIDVVLRSKNGNLLFLESKFTEYLTPSSSPIADHYMKFYMAVLPKIKECPLQLVYPRKYVRNNVVGVGVGLQPKSSAILYKQLYMDGIKQCFSHLIGIARGQSQGKKFECWNLLKKSNLRFATVLYEFKGDSFNAYKKFYNEVFGELKDDDIKSALYEYDNIHIDELNSFDIEPNILTYQDIFNNIRNINFLPDAVRKFYRL